MTDASDTPHEPKTLREFPGVGRYRVRILRSATRRDPSSGHVMLDIREYLETESYTGWTRRGIRLYGLADVRALCESLGIVQRDRLLPEEGPADPASI